MASARQFRYYRGALLIDLCNRLGIPDSSQQDASAALNDMFKEYLCVKHVSELDEGTTEIYLSAVRMLCAREMGYQMPLPHEPPSEVLERMSMWEYLNYIERNG